MLNTYLLKVFQKILPKTVSLTSLEYYPLLVLRS